MRTAGLLDLHNDDEADYEADDDIPSIFPRSDVFPGVEFGGGNSFTLPGWCHWSQQAGRKGSMWQMSGFTEPVTQVSPKPHPTSAIDYVFVLPTSKSLWRGSQKTLPQCEEWQAMACMLWYVDISSVGISLAWDIISPASTNNIPPPAGKIFHWHGR
jgi:hypothetical protein